MMPGVEKHELHKEKELFLRIADRDEYAFRELVVLYGPRIRPVIMEIIRDVDHTKDLIQEVFLQLWLGGEKLRTVESPRSWIFRIAYYQSYNWMRQKKVRAIAREMQANDSDVADPGFSAEDLLTLRQTQTWLQEAIQALSPKARNIYFLSRNEGLKPAEIARKLNIPVQTVKNTLHRAIGSIREFLAGKGIWLPAAFFFFSFS